MVEFTCFYTGDQLNKFFHFENAMSTGRLPASVKAKLVLSTVR